MSDKNQNIETTDVDILKTEKKRINQSWLELFR